MNFKDCKYVSDIPQSFFINNSIDFEYVQRWSIGQLGAYFSIREMIKMAYEKGYNDVLIFEDDILPLNINFTAKINDVISQLPIDWDIFQLGYEYDGRFYKLSYQRSFRILVHFINIVKKYFNKNYIKILPKKYTSNIDYSGNSYGGHALIISNRGMKKLLDNMTPLREGGDVLINSMITQMSINAYAIYPILFMQLDKNNSSTR